MNIRRLISMDPQDLEEHFHFSVPACFPTVRLQTMFLGMGKELYELDSNQVHKVDSSEGGRNRVSGNFFWGPDRVAVKKSSGGSTRTQVQLWDESKPLRFLVANLAGLEEDSWEHAIKVSKSGTLSRIISGTVKANFKLQISREHRTIEIMTATTRLLVNSAGEINSYFSSDQINDMIFVVPPITRPNTGTANSPMVSKDTSRSEGRSKQEQGQGPAEL